MNQTHREKKQGKQQPEVDFFCKSCGQLVRSEGAGSLHRNHCPYCLASVHLDRRPGDRAAECGGVMDPIGVWVRRGGE